MARRDPKTTHPSPEVPPPLSLSQFPGPPSTADGCWVRGVSVGAVLATQHRRAGFRWHLPNLGWAFLAELGASVETDDTEPLHAMPALWPGSSALHQGTRTSPSWPQRREDSLGTGHGEASSSLCRFPLFLPPVWLLAAEPQRWLGRGAGDGLAKHRQPPAAPRPLVPRLVAGRRAACAWQGSVSCGRIPAPRWLPISQRAGTTGGSGGTVGEGWGGRIVKGREEKKLLMDTCHRWSGEAAKTPAGSTGPKPAAAERRVWQPIPAWDAWRTAARQKRSVVEAGRGADGGAGEE